MTTAPSPPGWRDYGSQGELSAATYSTTVRWLVIALAVCTAINVPIFLGLLAQGETLRSAIEHLPTGRLIGLKTTTWVDSWWPMIKACSHHLMQPDESLYAVFNDGVKFQYPPSALLLCEQLPSAWLLATDDRQIADGLLQLLSWSSRLAVIATWGISAYLIVSVQDRLHSPQKQAGSAGRLLLFVLAFPLAATFYPIVHGYRLGQIQVFLDAGVALAILSFIKGRRGWSGVILAGCTLIKPQFAMVLLWSLWRREHRFSLGYALGISLGLLLSLWRFGFADHWAYVEVLREIARHGESLYLNQSVNGLLNRWLENGVIVPPVGTFQSDFAPDHAGIRLVTMVSSVVILLLALDPVGWRRRSTGIVDLAAMLAAATIAAPVAWDHHYGIFLPMFAVMLPLTTVWAPQSGAKGALLGISFFLVGFAFVDPSWFLLNPYRILLISHVFFGAIVFFGLLLAMRASQVRGFEPFPLKVADKSIP